MRPLAALENYVDVMRDTPFFVHPTRPPPRLSPLPSPPLPSPSHPRFNLKTVFGLSRIHKIQLSFSFLPPSLLPLHEETRPRLDSSFLLAGSIMIRLTEQRAFEIRKRRGYSERWARWRPCIILSRNERRCYLSTGTFFRPLFVDEARRWKLMALSLPLIHTFLPSIHPQDFLLFFHLEKPLPRIEKGSNGEKPPRSILYPSNSPLGEYITTVAKLFNKKLTFIISTNE